MPATLVGIIYDVASRLAVCGIKPDADAQLNDPAWLGTGQAMLIAPLAQYNQTAGTPHPFDQLLSAAIGPPLAPDRYCIIDKTNTVVSVIKAVPSYTLQGFSIVPHTQANVGDTYIGLGAFTTLGLVGPTPDGSQKLPQVIVLAATSAMPPLGQPPS